MPPRALSSLLLLLVTALDAACAPQAPRFSVQNARAHIEMLAATIGSRPTGSEPNRRARDYIAERLRSYGFAVRLQEADAVRPLTGTTVHLSNIIAARPGRRSRAIALVSHYDSVPDGPGAADDAFGVAVSLEAGRVLAQRRAPTYPLLVIVTDGEELGLMGATALMKDPIARDIGAVINFEAVGSGGPDLLFETGPGSASLLDSWARSAPQPAGASYNTEIYKRLPNDTDFTVFRRAGIPGLNFAIIGDSYSYHTARDNVSRLDSRVLGPRLANTIAVVEKIDETADLSRRTAAQETYFDILHRWAITYRSTAAVILLAAALLLALFGWLTVAPAAREAAGIGRIVLTFVWSVVGIGAIFVAMLGVAWVLRATREVYEPWYAHPDRFFTCLVIAAVSAGWVVMRVGRLLPAGARGSTDPAVTWTVVLPCWVAIALAAQAFAAAAAYLAIVPVLAAGAVLMLSPVRRTAGIRVASVIVLGVSGTLWIPSAVDLLHFAIPVFGRLPIITPLFVYPLLLLFCGLFVVPPLLALFGPPHRSEVRHPTSEPVGLDSQVRHRGGRGLSAGPCLAGLLVITAAWCWFAPAYSDDRPLHASITYVKDADAGAYWQIGSNEPGVHVGIAPPASAGWTDGAIPRHLAAPIRSSFGPFVFRTAAVMDVASPIVATGSLVQGDDGGTIEVKAVPGHEGVAVTISLPAGIVPEETNLAGTQQEGRPFTARYVAPGPDGVTLRARISAADVRRMESGSIKPEAVVVAIVPGLPGAAWPALPRWLPQGHVAWQARTFFMVRLELR